MNLFLSGRSFALAAGLMLAGQSFSAHADDHPRLAPTRDVTVTYRMLASKTSPQSQDVKVYFSGSGDLLRIDSSDGHGVTILDRPNQKVTLVMLSQRVYTQFSPREGLRNPFLLDLTMHYTPAGEGNIAGVACHKWSIDTSHGKASACVTEDGVILSESGVDADGVEGSLVAQKVSYNDIPASLFLPPEGFERIQPHHRIPSSGEASGGTQAAPPVPGAPVAGAVGAASGQPALAPQDLSQPSVPNDSAGDGTTSHADQPPSGPSVAAPQK